MTPAILKETLRTARERPEVAWLRDWVKEQGWGKGWEGSEEDEDE